MSVNGTIQLAYQDSAWFNDPLNAEIILKEGQHVYLSDSADEFLSAYVVGDGVTELQNLPWKGLITGVQSVTGPNVDNTDPFNPFVNNLGLIQIVDLAGDFFTDLATAMTYIRTYIDENIFPITDESFNSGVYYFTVPQNTECILASNFLGDDSNTITAYIIDRLGLIIKYTTKCFQKNAGNNYLGDCEFDIPSGSSSDSPFFYATGENSIGSFTLTTTIWFAIFSTGSFIFKGNIGATENTSYIISSTASFSVKQSKYTSNAGKPHASLVNNPKVFFGGIDKVEKNIVVASSITAELDTNYTNTSNATYTDPTPIADRGYTVLVLDGTATIGGTSYNVKGTKIERIYHGGAWISYVYSNGGLMVDYSSSSTYNGWSAFTTQKVFGIDYALYTIWTVEVSGTSDSALASVTIPIAHNSTVPNIQQTCLVVNNAVASATGRVRLDAGGATISWATSATGGGFSVAGTKTVRCQITIYK